MDLGVLIVLQIVLKRKGTAPEQIILVDLLALEEGRLPLIGELVLYFDLEEERLDDIALGRFVFGLLLVFGLCYLLEGELVAAVEVAVVVVAGQMLFLLQIEHPDC